MSGGLVPWFTWEREIFYGDRSQTITVGVIWLRLGFEVSWSLPWKRRWTPL